MKTEFTGKEEAVLFHLYHSMKGNGFDFGLVDEVRPAGIAAKQAGSVMRALRKKLCIDMGDFEMKIRFGLSGHMACAYSSAGAVSVKCSGPLCGEPYHLMT